MLDDNSRAARWDTQYRAERWDYLASPAQRPRYEAIAAAAVSERRMPVHVLDLGCGTGLLSGQLPPSLLASYTGVDFSAEAIARARAADGAARLARTFVQADLASWRAPRSYDVIVFNETLYYLDRPRALTREYARALAPGGVLVVCMYVPPWRRGVRWRGRIERIWRQLGRDCAVLGRTLASAPEGGRRWRVERLRPRRP